MIPLRLPFARAVAWALLLGGWLVLGALGRQRLPLWADGLLPVALWLGATGAGLAAVAGRRIRLAPLRAALVACALGLALALLMLAQGGGAGWLLWGAGLWGGLLVAASLAVRALRRQGGQRPPAPVLPAVAGACAAWALAGDPLALRASVPHLQLLALALVVAALGLALLLRGPLGGLVGCRAGLFDCAWPLPALARWRQPAAWPQQAAVLGMLPMMASLVAMAEWCGSTDGLAPATTVALHLGAMLGPALLLRLWPAWLHGRSTTPWLLALLLGGVGLAWARPGLAGWMAASLLQAMAWSLAWAGPLLQGQPAHVALPGPSDRGAPQGPGPGRAGALGTAALVLALGAALAAAGPQALLAVQTALALLALGGAAAARLHAARPAG